ncbi:MAG: MopE-related protein [Myxococcota bacterium]
MRAGIVVLLSLAACKGDGTDPAGGRPAVGWSEESLNFGEVALGESAELTFDVTNEGGGELEVYTVIVSDGDRDEWDVSWDSSNRTLARGESLTVSVFFAPERADRTSNGRIQVRTNDEEATTFFIPVTGASAPSNADNDGDGYTVAQGDCNDDNENIHPGANERCNGVDDDCQGGPAADEVDADGDGVRLCQMDCDDGNPNVYPGAPEACDGLDSDCDGVNQDNADADGDTFTVCDGDCNDANPNAYPGNTEVCGDNADNDCDGSTDVIDADGDGHDVCSATGDCDDTLAAVHPIIVSTSGSAGGAGTPADPIDSISGGLAALDAVCRTVFVESGTYTLVDQPWTTGTVTIRGRGASPADVTIDAGGNGRHLDMSGGTLTVNRLTFEGGVAPGGGSGGSVNITGGAFTAVDSVWQSNSAGTAGGAIRASDVTVSLQQSCRFEGNDAASGGAISVTNTTLFDPNGSVFLSNSATGAGGGIEANGSTLIMAGSSFESNTAATGGGLSLTGGGGHLIQRGFYFDNGVTSGASDGAALWVSGTTDGLWRNNEVRDNDGGAVVLTGAATFRVLNNTFTSNVGTGEGVVIDVESDNATVLANLGHFNDGPSGIYAPPGSLAVVEYNTVFATSTSNDFAGALSVGVGNNRSENPGFVTFTDDGDPTNDDLSLNAGSPSIDSGPPEAQYNDPDATQNDRGSTGGPGGQ